MTLEDAVLWLDRKARSLEADLDDEVDRRHAEAKRAVLTAFDRAWELWGVGNAWSVDDAGYPARLASLVADVDAIATPFLDGLRPTFERYGDTAWRFGYYGALWLLSMQLPTATQPTVGDHRDEDVRAMSSRPWQGGDLASALASARLDFLRQARKEFILSQAAKEGQAQARRRLLVAFGAETRLAESGSAWTLSEGEIALLEGRGGGKQKPRAGVVTSRTGVLAKLRAIAATQVQHGRAQGSVRAEEDNLDKVNGFLWITAQDEKVCRSCGDRQGKWYRLGSERPPLHFWCRCYAYNLAKSFEELGVSPDVPGMLPSPRPYAEWALDAGVRYDGGLGSLPLRKGKAGGVFVSVPRLPKPGDAASWADIVRQQRAPVPAGRTRAEMVRSMRPGAVSYRVGRGHSPAAPPVVVSPEPARVAMFRARRAAAEWARRRAGR